MLQLPITTSVNLSQQATTKILPGCHKVKLINPGELVDLRVMGCKDGKWHDFVNGVSFPEDAVVELTPGNVTEFVCVRGTDMETMVMIMMS